MATRKKTTRARKAAGAAEPADVDAFFATFEHPHLDALAELRRVILGADEAIEEGIKWKVPSFRTGEWFATLHVRAKQGVGVILHFGARKRGDLPGREAIADPTGILEWLADDRAVATFADKKDVKARAAAFRKLLANWIAHV